MSISYSHKNYLLDYLLTLLGAGDMDTILALIVYNIVIRFLKIITLFIMESQSLNVLQKRKTATLGVL